MSMKVQILTREKLESKIDQFIFILSSYPGEYWGKEHFLYDLEGKWKYSLYIEENGIVLGYIIASKKEKSVHIHKIMVRDEYKNRGLGTLLENKLVNICLLNSINKMSLKVDKNNGDATKFYTKKGFIVSGHDNKHLLMEKNIL